MPRCKQFTCNYLGQFLGFQIPRSMLKFESLLDHLKFSENRAIFGPFEFMGQLEREVGWSHFRTIPNFGSVGAGVRLEPFCDNLSL